MSEIYKMIAIAVIVALITTFIVLFITKVEIRDMLRNYLDKKRVPILPNLLDCDFCLCFWIAFIINIAFFIAGYSNHLLIIPILSTPISRFLL